MTDLAETEERDDSDDVLLKREAESECESDFKDESEAGAECE